MVTRFVKLGVERCGRVKTEDRLDVPTSGMDVLVYDQAGGVVGRVE